MRKNFFKILMGLIVSGAIFLTLLVFLFVSYSKNLPDYEQLKSYTPLITTRLYSADGNLIGEYSKEKRIFVPIHIIPKHLINAFLAAEDSNFYNHLGVDPLAIVRAAILNLFSFIRGGQIVGGASTITQQVVKSFLLTNEQTFQRKIKEAILAYKMSKSFTKDQILELYLNQIYLGSGAYGVAAAAQVYFNRSIDELMVEEVALLATLPKAPSKLDPRKNMDKAKIRRDWVIERMIKQDFISQKEGKEAMSKPITLKMKDDENIAKADAFADSVKKELTILYGSDDVFENGIVVRTTLNSNLQKIGLKALQNGIENYDTKHGWRGSIVKLSEEKLQNWQEELKKITSTKLYKDSWQKAVVLSVTKDSAMIGIENSNFGSIDLASIKWARKHINVNSLGAVVKKMSDVLTLGDVILVENIKDNKYNLRQIPEVNGALLAMNPHNGKILAMMGGYIDAPNQFNRSIQAQRQPGSTLKTFAYIAALENGMTPANIIMDEPISLNQGPNLPPYQPVNFSHEFYGPTTLRRGLEKSINITTVRMADQIGIDKVAEVLKRFGINDNPPKYYSIALGALETSLLKLTTAYAIIDNGGKKITPSMIEKIQDRGGKVIYRRQNLECQICLINGTNSYSLNDDSNIVFPSLEIAKQTITDSATSYQITSMLEGVVQRGTAFKAREVGKIIAGKTGTTDSSFDSWFMGFSPDLVVGVYIGFDNPTTLGRLETGSSVALPVFTEFMKEALKDKPSIPFRVPDSVKFIKIDRTTGQYATPSTPKEDIFFEAFKLNDSLEEETNLHDNNEPKSLFNKVFDNSEGEEDSLKSDMGGIY
jgi:penicillin-binding protein 1A